jgi:long-chain acyl-CoA synthetase
MLNCSVILEESARQYPDKTAVFCTTTNTKTTHTQLLGKVNQLANGLSKLGIRKCDKVLVVCPNRIEFPVLFYAILKMGAVMVPVNILSKRSELAYCLTDTKGKDK